MHEEIRYFILIFRTMFLDQISVQNCRRHIYHSHLRGTQWLPGSLPVSTSSEWFLTSTTTTSFSSNALESSWKLITVNCQEEGLVEDEKKKLWLKAFLMDIGKLSDDLSASFLCGLMNHWPQKDYFWGNWAENSFTRAQKNTNTISEVFIRKMKGSSKDVQ